MRLGLRADTLVEWLALRLGVVPRPAAEAWGGMALSSVLITTTRVGLFARLARGPGSTVELAAELGLDPTVTHLLVECLRSSGYLAGRPGGPYALTRSARRWLAPAGPLSVADFVSASQDYWSWWAGLTEVARTGRVGAHHAYAPDDPYWRRYIRGQHDLARLSAAYVAKRIPVPDGPRSLLDLGGAHGLYSIELCRRRPELAVTVLDLPGSTSVGQEIVTAAGMADRIMFMPGDVRTTGFPGGNDVVLCFNLVHHLAPDDVAALLARAHDALVPGGTLAVMDAFAVPGRRGTAAATVLNLFTFLSSGVAGYAPEQLAGWLRAAGFSPPRRIPVRRIPGQALFLAARGS